MRKDTRTWTVSCGTLVLDGGGRLLLGHVTGTAHWDIPKGMQDPGETTLEAAMRELREESGAAFAPERFADLGEFAYRRDKRLHLYRVEAGAELGDLSQLVCTSWFPHHRTGKPTLEMDGFRWAGRADISQLCWPRMANLLLTLDW
ncbi:MAG TPA: NUDIX hydrolase [Massilia sp.]|nr:NUDIX hydrolase [Massilia sp.]